jgi:hypothetical protein
MTTTALRFTGDYPSWIVLLVALGLALLMAWLYSRELRRAQNPAGKRAWLLVLLRSLTVFITTLTLAGPVLHHTTIDRQLQRIVIALDASASMRLTDDPPATDRTSASAAATPAPAALSRWDRAQNLLFQGNTPLLATLVAEHDVELVALRGPTAQRLWWRRQAGRDSSGPIPGQLPIPADASSTNLDAPLRSALDPLTPGTALVLLSDGQHNTEGSPEDLAATLKDSEITLFTLGLGSEIPPPDLAITATDIPESAFAQEQLRGSVTIRDSMPPGIAASVRIESQGTTLWTQSFTTDGKGERRFDFRFPVQDLPPAAQKTDTALRLLSVQVTAAGNQANLEKTRANNTSEIPLHVLDRKRRVLILDGRPRWESRYLHNHFDRDERWEARFAFDDFNPNGADSALARSFPATRDDLLTYDLVVIGDLTPARLRPEQITWLIEFVEQRGGGLIFIDGQRGHLKAWQQEKEASRLLPIQWVTTAPTTATGYLWNTETDLPTPAALLLAGSRSANAQLWPTLPPALWTAHVRPAPGAQVFAQLSAPTLSQPLPAIVFRPAAAGAVLYLSTDELWRWRYQVADLYHQRLWMQIAAWIAAPPFQIETPRLSIGSDRLRYRVGDQAEIRVRLRSASGAIITDANPQAFLSRDGETLGTIELTADPNHAGIYRGLTPRLKEGDFQIAIAENPTAPRSELRLNLRASDRADQELAQLTLNTSLLQTLAQTTGGVFLRESQASELPSLLKRADRKQTSIRETLLWSSWWWFGTLLALLTTEWLLRKRLKLI